MEKFVKIAKEYVSWVEDKNRKSSDDIQYVHDMLLSLYATAFTLKYHPETAELEEPRISHEEWKSIMQSFSHLPFDYYQEVFDPLDFSDSDPVTASLSDDLADIYRDLKPAVLAYDKGKVREAEDDIKRNFEIHWSEHAISALKAIRQYLETNIWKI